ncbi:thioredoxin [Pseudomonas sp. PIC25]|uniref:thioredoxin family protein n=1 Tax=Pseudomonas sp. PIC25 TaxID=1958773 RepID=UPI000BABDC09|nr:thioredoxin family protein [Pseudomonas sp. PIC25]PAU65166.1 thioredoxin [Pseudomonas sp. PIC25]
MPTFKSVIALLAACLLASGYSLGAAAAKPAHRSLAPIAPEFRGIDHWLNGPPQTLEHLRDKVVLVEFWTYSCINCIRVLPYVKEWHEKYRDKGLVVIGVHTPEYGYEKNLGNLQTAVKRFGITYPVAQDNGYRTWDAYGNQYWPALYLIDREGRIVYRHFGEGNYADTEAQIQRLLAAGRSEARGDATATIQANTP